MKIEGIIWLENIIEKLWVKHHVDGFEVEQVIENRPHYLFTEKGNIDNENVYSAFGQTGAGRYLIVIFILKPDNQALIISARDMSPKERKYYERKKN
jgi:uncharacterized protein